MKSGRSYRVYLEDMLRATEKALDFTGGIRYRDFEKDDEKIFAVTHAIEILGEAAKQVPAPIRNRHPEVPWKLIAGTRDKLIHLISMCTRGGSGRLSGKTCLISSLPL